MHHRTDIQGLRALAVLAVVVAHAGAGIVGGGFVGVDLFFVLSGFLITELLIREADRDGRISLPRFWARRVRRLLPASMVVLVTTALASSVVLPATQRAAVGTDILWSALFAANWRMADQQTDYFAEDRAVSPVQHFWSLGVEEQFYVVWPLVVALCVVLVAARVGRVRVAIGSVAAVVGVASFAYSVHLTSVNQPLAYFGTPSRAWQLALGALLAAAVPLLSRLPRLARTPVALVGLAGFAWSVLALEEAGGSTSYPGVVALVPSLSAGLLLAAGTGGTSLVGRALSWAPLVWLGDRSYSLYLWHFPVLVLGVVALEPAGWLVRTVLVLASVAAAAVTYTLVENPLRAHPVFVRRTGLTLLTGAALVGTSVMASAAVPPTGAEVRAATTVRGLDGEPVDLGPALLDPLVGFERAPGCTTIAFDDSAHGPCDTYGAADGDRQVVVLGDSHAGNLAPGLGQAARDEGWGMTVWAKPSCPAADVTVYDASRKTPNTPCDTFRSEVTAETLAKHPDLVVLASAVNDRKQVVDRETGEIYDAATSAPMIVEGWRTSIRRFTDAGIPVVVVADWPRAPESPPDCLAASRDVAACTFERPDGPRPELQAVEGMDTDLVHVVTLEDDFCDERTCAPVVGDVLVYRDTNHFTFGYMAHRADDLDARVLGAVDG